MKPQNIYVGARYVPRLMGEWNNETAYEAIDLVTSNGVGYVSRKPVPAGTPVTNTEYWAYWSSGDVAVDELTNRVVSLETTSQQHETEIETLKNNVSWIVPQNIHGDGVTDNTMLFNALDAETPIVLLPGTYNISTDTTIPCYVQFMPGAYLHYTGEDNCTVTFLKSFIAEQNAQVFDGKIIVRDSFSNNVKAPYFKWFGGDENKSTSENTPILLWLLSAEFGATEIKFSPGSYQFGDLSTAYQAFKPVGEEIAISAVKMPKGTYNGITFTAIEGTDGSDYHDCYFRVNAPVNVGNNCTLEHCNFVLSGTASGDALILGNGNTYNGCNITGTVRGTTSAVFQGNTKVDSININALNTVTGQLATGEVKAKNVSFGASATVNCTGLETYQNCQFQNVTINTSYSAGTITFIGCQFEGINFEGTGNTPVKFIGCKYSGSTITIPTNATFEGCNLYGVNVTNNGTLVGCIAGSVSGNGAKVGCTVGGKYDPGTADDELKNTVSDLTNDLDALTRKVNSQALTIQDMEAYKHVKSITTSGVFTTIKFTTGWQIVSASVPINASLTQQVGSMWQTVKSPISHESYPYPSPFTAAPSFIGADFRSTNYQGALVVLDIDSRDDNLRKYLPEIQLMNGNSRTCQGNVHFLIIGQSTT